MLDERALANLLSAPESERLEFKSAVPRPGDISRLISAFANTSGGVVVFGYHKPTRSMKSVDRRQLESAVRRALSILTTPAPTRLSFVEVGGEQVGVLEVERSTGAVGADGGYYKRVGESTRPLTAPEIQAALLRSPEPPQVQIDQLVEAVSKQADTVERMRSNLEKANAPARKLGYAALGAAAGVVGKWVGGLLLEIISDAF